MAAGVARDQVFEARVAVGSPVELEAAVAATAPGQKEKEAAVERARERQEPARGRAEQGQTCATKAVEAGLVVAAVTALVHSEMAVEVAAEVAAGPEVSQATTGTRVESVV